MFLCIDPYVHCVLRSGEPGNNHNWSPAREALIRGVPNPVLVYANSKENQGFSAVVPPAPFNNH